MINAVPFGEAQERRANWAAQSPTDLLDKYSGRHPLDSIYIWQILYLAYIISARYIDSPAGGSWCHTGEQPLQRIA
jgi:hypothetical protein